MEQNYFSNFGRESFKEHFYERKFEIRPLAYEKMSLKVFFLFLALVAIFLQPSTSILAYLVEGNPGNISMKLFEN